ncbi:MAG: hypothetical protein GY862_35975, partial [Gammaproteobacteria bacterium]|nr:hypothetical protein [Gammaproteobacteria bacterium]
MKEIGNAAEAMERAAGISGEPDHAYQAGVLRLQLKQADAALNLLRPLEQHARLNKNLVTGIYSLHFIEAGEYEREFVEKYTLGFKAFAAYARQFTPERVARETGVPADRLSRMARLMMEGQPRVANYTG